MALAAVALVCAAVHGLRWALWKPWRTLRTPLVWVLQAAYAWIPLHLALRAAAEMGWVAATVATHALTVGAAGGLIIGMMTRTARGHTARPLRADRFDIACYALVLLAAVVSGSLIFGSLFVIGGAFQVFAGDASEVANAFTYGGNTLTQFPLPIYPLEVVRAVTFLVPLAFVNWYPALYVLDLDDPFDLPGAFQLASPVVAALFVVVAAVAWRTGLRHYRSTGS